jgi:hypothetical protein
MKGMAMTTEQPRQYSEYGNNGPNNEDECADCDPARIDELKCKAAGVAAEAAYNAQYQDAVAAAQVKFTEVRDSYRQARSDVVLVVQDMRHLIRRVIERIKCLIKQERVVECLDDAWDDVREQLTECWTGGCCVREDQCVFDTDCEGMPEAHLKHRIAEYMEHAAKAKQCFDSLTGEPAALRQRVDERKAALDAIQVTLAGDPATTDLKRVYATALVERYKLSNVWNGFRETRDFVNCLCRALTCWTEGSVAIAALNNRLAVLECYEQARKDHCTSIQTHPVDEILTVYDKKCGKDPCPEEDEYEREDEEEDERERERSRREEEEHEGYRREEREEDEEEDERERNRREQGERERYRR